MRHRLSLRPTTYENELETRWAKQGRDLIKVLHVEDDPNCREAIADQLSDHGFVVDSCADARSSAAGLADSPDTDIILLDWDLPGPGYRLARRAAPNRRYLAGCVPHRLCASVLSSLR